MSLSLIAQVVRAKIAESAWIKDTEVRGEKVARYRRYMDGDHDANMTPEMRRLLRIKARENSAEFCDNYMDVVVQTMVDRVTLTAMDSVPSRKAGNNPPAAEDAVAVWTKAVLNFNRLDAMQGDVHESTIRDGNSFVMVGFDNDKQIPKFTHELAYDGVSGIIPVYQSADVSEMDCAIKVWHITSSEGRLVDTLRVNVYYPDRIQKFISTDGTSLTPFREKGVDGKDVTDAGGNIPWLDRAGKPLGIPIVHFRNRGRQNYGLSELENAIPLQDVVNRLWHSLVMTAELSAFRILVAKGFTPPQDLTPGMIVKILNNGGPLSKDDNVDFYALDEGSIEQFLKAIQLATTEIGKVTRTPAPEFMGADDSSGEALKQREIGLIGKVKRFQIKAGNSWEDVFGLAYRLQSAFGNKQPPAFERLYACWKDAEIRNDKVTIENANLIRPVIGDEAFLEIIAPVYGWDDDKVQEILAQAAEQKVAAMEAAMRAMPTFGGRQPSPSNGQMPVNGQSMKQGAIANG